MAHVNESYLSSIFKDKDETRDVITVDLNANKWAEWQMAYCLGDETANVRCSDTNWDMEGSVCPDSQTETSAKQLTKNIPETGNMSKS